METLVWYILVSRTIGIVVCLIGLGTGDYPRKQDDTQAWHDVLKVVIYAAIALWAGLLLYGGAD